MPGAAPDGERTGCCPYYHQAVELIGKRWTGAIVSVLLERPLRFSEIAAAVPQLSDRLLSERGQEIIAGQSALFELAPDMAGDAAATGIRAATSGPVIPITLSPALLVFLDRIKRESFLRQWRLAFQSP